MCIFKKGLALLCAVLFLAGCHSIGKKGKCSWKKGEYSWKKGKYGKKPCCKLWQSGAGYADILPVHKSDKGPVGTVSFEPTGKKQIQVQAHIKGLKPNQKFGFHVHEFGDCSNKALQAGGHFNPWGQKHGGLTSGEKHLGDMGNLSSDKEGKAAYKVVVSGPLKAFLGRSVIIHEKPDDLKSQPSGNSGGRIGCGIIGRVMSSGVKDDAKHKAPEIPEAKKAGKSVPAVAKKESAKVTPVKKAASKASAAKTVPVKAAVKAGVKTAPVKAAGKTGSAKPVPVKAADKSTPVKAAVKASVAKKTPVKAAAKKATAAKAPVKAAAKKATAAKAPVKAAAKKATAAKAPVKAAAKKAPVKAAVKAGSVKAAPVKAVAKPQSAKAKPVQAVDTASKSPPLLNHLRKVGQKRQTEWDEKAVFGLIQPKSGFTVDFVKPVL